MAGSLLAFLLLAGGCGGTAAGPDAGPGALGIAAASDLAGVMPQLAALHSRRTRRATDLVIGSSGLLSRQIAQGAPHDLFFSADRSWVDDLIRAGRALPEDLQIYAIGRLVLWTAGTGIAPESLEDLADPRFVRIAIANPEHAPYGRAAWQALETAGLLEAVRPRLVYGENILHALQLVRTGNAEAGLVALALAAGAADGRWVLIDDALHAPLEQVVAILASTADVDAAREFLRTLGSAEGRAVMSRLGLTLPGEPLPAELLRQGTHDRN